jgi:hypothetical protein
MGSDARPGVTSSSVAELDRRFRVALVLYGLLGLLIWFTVGDGSVRVQGKPVELRLVPLLVIGGLALRTWVARHAEKIRSQDGGAREGQSL